jgi:hypothetical protein
MKACTNCGYVKPKEPKEAKEAKEDVEPKPKQCKTCNTLYEGSYRKHTKDEKHKLIDDICKYLKTLDSDEAIKAKDKLLNLKTEGKHESDKAEKPKKKSKSKSKDPSIQFD